MSKQQYLHYINNCQNAVNIFIPVVELSQEVIEFVFGHKSVAYGHLCIQWYFGSPNKIMHVQHYIKHVMVNGLLTAVWAHSYHMVFKRVIVEKINLEAHGHNMLAYPETTRQLVRVGQRIIDDNIRLFWEDASEPIWVIDDEEIYIDELMEEELERILAAGGDDMREIDHMIIR